MFTLMILAAAAPTTDIRVPAGFTAELYADHTAANDIYVMTIDDAGRVLVGGRGYVRVVEGGNTTDILTDLKDGPMGLLAEGDALYVVADGGLKRYRGYNGRDRLKGPAETILPVKTAGEHDAHAVRRGPDGWLYLLCGNMAGVGKKHITSPRSPVADPIAGSLVRISPDAKQVEVVADGFRNAYSFDFDRHGEPFTYDSDNERCVGLPWYEPCRFYHVVPGGNYGWRSPQLSQTWRKPPYFPDVVPPVCTLGRGSPTGVAGYHHTHFPKEY
jgi:glucose/arabinose dehydrogenase